jgi:aspartyl/asparaginyl beta-hydroxylase (cupin superfamily)
LIIDNQQLAQTAFSALNAGDFKTARDGLEKIVASGNAEVPHCLGLAFSCAQMDDLASALVAVDKALELEPRNLRAILSKADFLHRQGDLEPALKHYRYALKLAENLPSIPNDIQQGLVRAQRTCDGKANEYQEFITEKLDASGYSPSSGNRRFQQSLELCFGTKKIYYQQPHRFYYPGLPQIQFYEREQFDWIAAIEAKTDQIRAELLAVINDKQKFSPYVKSGNANPGQNNQGLEDNDDWSAMYLWDEGNLVAENADLFPQTLKALSSAPVPEITDQAPMSLFSKLAANSKIPPHNGLLNTRLICHLPIIVPENCGALRVGNEERSWEEGKMLIFDDSIEHEAWNSSEKDRVILLFEIWRPEIDEQERQLITTMLKAVKEYQNNQIR